MPVARGRRRCEGLDIVPADSPMASRPRAGFWAHPIQVASSAPGSCREDGLFNSRQIKDLARRTPRSAVEAAAHAPRCAGSTVAVPVRQWSGARRESGKAKS